MTDLCAGDVIRMVDSNLRQFVRKRFICVCPVRLLFLRINSRDFWGVSCPLTVAQCPSLAYESRLQLNELLEYEPDEVREAVAAGNHLGRISREAFQYIAEQAQKSETMTAAHKRLIWEMFVTGRSGTGNRMS